MMRVGNYRAVHVKSIEAHMVRTVLQARRQIVAALMQIQGTVRGLLRVHGLKIGEYHCCKFADRVRELVAEKPMRGAAIDLLHSSAEVMTTERKVIDRRLEQAVRRDDMCLRLVTIPGVGPITSLAFRATVDEPIRF